MSPESPSESQIVRSFLEALEARDLDLAVPYVSADLEYQNMPFPAVRGPRGLRWVLAPCFRLVGFEARVDTLVADGPTVLTERTDAVLVGPVRIPFHVCGTFEVRDEQIVLWRDTFDWASAVVNTLLAGPIYLFRRIRMR